MPFITPREVIAKAENAYPRFLAKWIRGEDADYFPLRVPANLKRDKSNPRATIKANEVLLSQSKGQRGWGYTVHREQIASLDFGSNRFPNAITIDTLEDLLRLAGKTEEFESTGDVVRKVRIAFPQLEDWLHSSVKTLHRASISCDGLILVATYFVDHPWLNRYARQMPVSVDTKFVQRNEKTLRQWLDILLPSSAIDVNEKKFARRFGLHDGQPHRGIRLLDPSLAIEVGLPYGELSLPLDSVAKLTVANCAIFVVENDLNLVTMPAFNRGIGIRGEGNAVNRLEKLKWLGSNRVFYWGDIDVEGFTILSRLRNLFSHVESILMDRATLEDHRDFVVAGNASTSPPPTNLTHVESNTYEYCLRVNERLEQEKILQNYVDDAFLRLS